MDKEIKYIEETKQEDNNDNEEEKVTIPDWNIEPPVEIQRNKDEL